MAIRNAENIQRIKSAIVGEKEMKEQLRLEKNRIILDRLIARNQDIIDAIDTYYACHSLDTENKMKAPNIHFETNSDVRYLACRKYYDNGDMSWVFYDPKTTTLKGGYKRYRGFGGSWKWNVSDGPFKGSIELVETLVCNLDTLCKNVFDFAESL